MAHEETRDFDTALLHGTRETRLRGSLEDGENELPEAPIHTARYAALYDCNGYQRLDATDSFARAPPALETFDVEGTITARGAFVEVSLRGMPLRGVLLPATDRVLLVALSRARIDSDLRLLTGIFSTLFVVATGLTWLVASWLGAAPVARRGRDRGDGARGGGRAAPSARPAGRGQLDGDAGARAGPRPHDPAARRAPDEPARLRGARGARAALAAGHAARRAAAGAAPAARRRSTARPSRSRSRRRRG